MVVSTSMIGPPWPDDAGGAVDVEAAGAAARRAERDARAALGAARDHDLYQGLLLLAFVAPR